MKLKTLLPLSVLSLAVALTAFAADEKKPAEALKAFMITGGCCHDYPQQKNIIAAGVSERLNVEWEVLHVEGKQPEIEAELREKLGKDGWADGYDVIVYNHCAAKETDGGFVDKIAEVHKAGKPAIALHCAMHSWHWELPLPEGDEKAWPKVLGVSSKGHGPKAQITVTKVAEQKDHPVIKDLPDGWVTPEGELYNVQKILDSATVLAYGENGKAKEPQAVIWVNTYGKGKVFSTTIGHHNSTMSTPEYLDLIANGVKWVTAE